mmetsp:Transcript_54927/g.146681  ORF Transcript_54927/g.146681 Transcript_54927/m.146681 type:complete len:105 (-) Transcript_54927:21-335(-)
MGLHLESPFLVNFLGDNFGDGCRSLGSSSIDSIGAGRRPVLADASTAGSFEAALPRNCLKDIFPKKVSEPPARGGCSFGATSARPLGSPVLLEVCIQVTENLAH